ncbi:MAG: helix-turn-helix domain-containing protein [Pseudobdellovibrionaceae bacterium]
MNAAPKRKQDEHASEGKTPCPAQLTLSLIANKWSLGIIHALVITPSNTLRFGELMRLVGKITQRELTKQLREFEKSGLVMRTSYPEVPPRVEYRLTKLGLSLEGPVEALNDWAAEHGRAIIKNREKYSEQE